VNAISYLGGQLLRFDRLNVDPMLPVLDGLTPALGLQAAMLAGALAIGMASIRRRPALAFGMLWFFLWLAPTNSLLPRLDVANDRQLYLALIGPAWLAGLGVETLWRRWLGATAAFIAALLVGFAAATHSRNEVYANEVVFWQDVVGKTPGNSRAFNNLGYAYAVAGRDSDAERSFRRALEIDPANRKAAVNLALLLDGSLLPAAE
jgi:hypothetical protein